MKKLYKIKECLISLALITSGFISFAQCPIGSSTASLNWDNLDYLTQNGTYATFVTTAMMQTQKFTIGTNIVTIIMPGSITTNGENTTNTAEAGSFGTGADVEYSGNGSIIITFDAVVNNLQFSLYDIDASQKVTVTAIDAAATPVALNVSMTAVTTGVNTITGNNTTSAVATASNTSLGNTDTRGTLNISITGSSPVTANGVKQVTITLAGTAGNFWLSDLTACVFGSFPTNYYASQKPWTGQPAYFLVTPDNNSVYVMNPLTGKSDWLFSEPNSPWVNSLAYDYIHKVIYYVMDHSPVVPTNKALKKYDVTTGTISTVVADITTLGIPVYDMAVESAGAAYYNGSLFLGIEGTNSAKTSNRESTIWRIDFDAAQNPIRASQVFAQPTDNGAGTLMHDWGDFTIKDGVLFDFNTGNGGTTSQFIHYNMQSGGTTIYNTSGNPQPVQAGQTWDGSLYWTGDYTSQGRVAKYNENGTIGTKIATSVTACSPAWVGHAGDASDPYRPQSDFGDAPDTYDPIPAEKATHEFDCNLQLGPTFDREWDKTPSPNATGDGSDEDGITTVTVLNPGVVNYVQDVKVYNNTGTNATLAGWLDYNGNGVFDPSEGVTATVPTNPNMQTVTLSWTGISVPLTAGASTFMRIRVTSASNNMTINTPTRWFANGEVEDYMVFVDAILPIRLLAFTAKADGNDKVLLNWITGKEINFHGFDIERSADGTNWQKIGTVDAHSNNASTNNYSFYDNHPLAGKNYYRLKMINVDGTFQYSDVRLIEWQAKNIWLRVTPNPVTDHAVVQYILDKNEPVTLNVVDANGRKVVSKYIASNKGLNQMTIDDLGNLSPGVYVVVIATGSDVVSTKIMVQ
jgi:hypothetical protein